ncbi:MAG: hypothetical protein JST00_24235 [Deltaproteobacteria bacterium]|nr:hypothetical protein [Deltaproteobacteria bacterium]
MSMSTTNPTFGRLASPSAAAPRAWRFLLRAAVGVALATTIVGLLHMPFAAPLLRAITPSWACPIRRGTPEQIDRAHAMGAANIRANARESAPARPALGFALDTTTRGDIRAWASKNGVSCAAIGGNDNLQKCTNVPAAAVGQPAAYGPLEEITFELRATGELVNVQTMRRGLTAEAAATIAGDLEARMRASLGEPTQRGGEPTAAHLSHGVLSTFVAVHQFTDYRATVTATNLAGTGTMVREEYLSAR